MIIESIALVIFIFSLGGVLLILVKKIPVLSILPKNGSTGLEKYKIVLDAENKMKYFYSFFSKGIILHKFLSWSKCQIMKIETKIDEMLHGIRRKAKEEKLNGKK